MMFSPSYGLSSSYHCMPIIPFCQCPVVQAILYSLESLGSSCDHKTYPGVENVKDRSGDQGGTETNPSATACYEGHHLKATRADLELSIESLGYDDLTALFLCRFLLHVI
jgi:hypothetical protein